jgi:hypothetical protein
MSTKNKRVFGQPRSPLGKQSHSLTISLYPHQRDVLSRRERELNLHRSVIIQILLDAEETSGLVRQALIARLTPRARPNTATKETQPA